jgi:hypothetical protein
MLFGTQAAYIGEQLQSSEKDIPDRFHKRLGKIPIFGYYPRSLPAG